MNHATSRTRRPGEQGMALVIVLLLGLIAIALGTALVSYGSTSTPLSRQSQDWNGAMSAAEAGLDDYIHKLTVDGNYWTHGSTPPEPNAALTGFKDIPGVAKAGEFTYSVVDTPTPARPTVRLEVTGKVRGEERTVQATLRRSSFLDYIYLTNFETKDPIAYDPAVDGAGRTVAYAAANCGERYRFAVAGISAARGTNACTEIQFASFDRIRGPLYSNDSLLIAGGATFEDTVQSNWRAGPVGNLWVPIGVGLPNFLAGSPVVPSQVLEIPPSNAKLEKLADGAQGGLGCLYTGPTRIHLNPDGTMNVHSPRTRSTRPNCVGTNLPLPVNNVIYVQNVPPSTSTDPNRNPSATNPCTYWTSATAWTGCGLPNGAGVRYPPGFTVPVAGDRTNGSPVDKYVPTNGDVFLTGTLDGKLTIGSENDIVIMDDVRYEDRSSASDDILGLIPQNSVKVFHPVDNNGDNLANPWTGGGGGATIHAAILAVGHSFAVQNYRYGAPLGVLNVFGAISQNYRGIVGRTGSPNRGFQKDYEYDSRLRVQSPPHFLDPEKTAWEIKTWSEVGVNR